MSFTSDNLVGNRLGPNKTQLIRETVAERERKKNGACDDDDDDHHLRSLSSSSKTQSSCRIRKEMDPLFHIPRPVRNRSQFVICTAALEPSSITLLLSPQWLLQILLPFTLLVWVGGEGYFSSRMRTSSNYLF